MAGFRERFLGDKETKNPSVVGWMEKEWITLQADLLQACGVGKISALSWQYSFQDWMLGVV